jgi:putative flippase GtrA
VRVGALISELSRFAANGRLARYLLVGCVNTIVGLGVIFACMSLMGMSNVRSNAVGYAVGVGVSFMLNKGWTFAHDGPMVPAFLRFAAVLCIAYAANLLAVIVLVDQFGLNRFVAQAAGTVPYTTVGYLGSRFFAFRRPTSAATRSGRVCS